jgi:acyl carrier protein
METVFRSVLDLEELSLTREMTAAQVDGWDSLAHIHLIVALEAEFGIRFRTADIVRLKNVGEMMDLIEATVAAKQA